MTFGQDIETSDHINSRSNQISGNQTSITSVLHHRFHLGPFNSLLIGITCILSLELSTSEILLVNDLYLYAASVDFCPGYASTVNEDAGSYSVDICRVGLTSVPITVK